MTPPKIDKNENGIDDRIEHETMTFHWKSGLIGCVVGMFGMGIVLSIMIHFFPNMAFLSKIFAGNICDGVQTELNRCNNTVICYSTASVIMNIDDSKCQSIYLEGEQP